MIILLAFIGGLILGSVGAYVLFHSFQKRLEQVRQEQQSEREKRDEEAKIEREQQHKQQLELLSSHLEAASQQFLKERAEALDKANTASVGQLLIPIKQEMENVRKLMGDTRSANETSTASLKGALEAMMKQTNQISQEANNLADALKNRGKVHGDWGEQVLEDILAGSGLRKGCEYTTQQSFKGEKGNELRTDIIVNCADGQRIIIDSKVSLTAYANALGADTEEQRESAVRENYKSVQNHVDELVRKQYPKYVQGAMNYVLMFIPNEGAYVMAMNYHQSLAQEAYRKGVVIVNPTNLMLTLHLVLQAWQQTRQQDNCKQILLAANNMYDKLVGLVDTCNDMGNQLNTLARTYQKAIGQLSEGKGNLLRQVENMRELGITSTKRPKRLRESAPEETDDMLFVPEQTIEESGV